jgi:hypothetical protein
MDICHLCKAPNVVGLLDFGPQPICNRFLTAPDAEEAKFPMRFGQCGRCGLVQIVSPVPARELKPRVDWITYNEPEGHLDHLADLIAKLPGITKDSAICGVSFKDDSLLRRLRERGYPHARRLDPQNDLGIVEPGAGVETIQDRLTVETATRIAQSPGKAAVVIARHIWEHASDPAKFINALKAMMRPDGYLVLEIPDCERALTTCDYSTMWEEHSLYFTPATFRHGILLSGLAIVAFHCFPYTLENSLVAVARIDQSDARALPAQEVLNEEKSRGQNFAGGLATQREKIGNYFAGYRDKGKIAILGAGHLACTFINLLDLKEHIDCLVDDNPHKRGLFMPGSRLPIYGTHTLLERDIKLCLLSVAAEIEERVISKNQAFVVAGGTFASIFPASKHALRM